MGIIHTTLKGKDMGHEFEVWTWKPNGKESYSWILLYSGDDKSKALMALDYAKEADGDCVKLEWR